MTYTVQPYNPDDCRGCRILTRGRRSLHIWINSYSSPPLLESVTCRLMLLSNHFSIHPTTILFDHNVPHSNPLGALTLAFALNPARDALVHPYLLALLNTARTRTAIKELLS